MRPSDTETDSLGVSVDSEGQACAAREADTDRDLVEYGRSLGLSDDEAGKDANLRQVVQEAFEAPLPNAWTEHVDAEGRVYFFNQPSSRASGRRRVRTNLASWPPRSANICWRCISRP
uniref:WW domain-containing protein n=1 Tax=Alexandrium monilatum TaxID=311494 RepID=A0A7S4UGL1_9DINO|mmetsp:Transcript_11066/g.33343  ORF Transcript_11066/g.33343 Transcript_11066/m.33343 type:complete len:118 (-) Transcript_11066:439-792(-)